MIISLYGMEEAKLKRRIFVECPPFSTRRWAEAPCSRGGSFYGHFLHRGVGWHGEALGLEVYAGHLDGKDGWRG